MVRVVLLGLTLWVITFMMAHPNMIFAGALIGIVVVVQMVDLFHFVTRTNRKLTRFLESVKYSDFISGFSTDNHLGKSFKDLNTAFNEVLEAFRKTRSEREEHWQYLNTVVQQVRVGLLSYDAQGRIELMNTNAKRLLGVIRLENIEDLLEQNPRLYKVIFDTEPGKSNLYKGGNELHLTIQATELRIRSNTVRLITLQNIQPELQKQELEAWQNLTSVLRHEIMNSITPISSLTSTLKDVLAYDLIKKGGHYELREEGADDLREGLNTIESRSKGLIKFIDAYREYTSLPQPRLKTVRLQDLIDKVALLMKPALRQTNIQFSTSCTSEYLTLQADEEMLEQVLINLVKNGFEAVGDTAHPRVQLNGSYDENAVKIEVIDNGAGIIREAIESIFVPFYTTKKRGSGIGLSLSRQIMQLHHGTLTVTSEPDVSTVFTLRF